MQQRRLPLQVNSLALPFIKSNNDYTKRTKHIEIMVMKVDNLDMGDGEPPRTGIYVTDLTEHDVLLGRGTGPSSNNGNVQFRIAVEDMKAAYISTPSRKAKNVLVRKTVESIQSKNGRFLNKLRKSEVKMLGMSTHKPVYEVVHDTVACEKTKQAIRYVHYKKDAKKKDATSNVTTAAKTKRSVDTATPPASPPSKKAKVSPKKAVVEVSDGSDASLNGSSVSGRASPSSPTPTESALAKILLAKNNQKPQPFSSSLTSLLGAAVPPPPKLASASSLGLLLKPESSPLFQPTPAPATAMTGLAASLLLSSAGGYPTPRSSGASTTTSSLLGLSPTAAAAAIAVDRHHHDLALKSALAHYRHAMRSSPLLQPAPAPATTANDVLKMLLLS